ncbi:Uncharacterized protein DAT39_015958, partial [Clarias magur]
KMMVNSLTLQTSCSCSCSPAVVERMQCTMKRTMNLVRNTRAGAADSPHLLLAHTDRQHQSAE